jgi:hypothetical protein
MDVVVVNKTRFRTEILTLTFHYDLDGCTSRHYASQFLGEYISAAIITIMVEGSTANNKSHYFIKSAVNGIHAALDHLRWSLEYLWRCPRIGRGQNTLPETVVVEGCGEF